MRKDVTRNGCRLHKRAPSPQSLVHESGLGCPLLLLQKHGHEPACSVVWQGRNLASDSGVSNFPALGRAHSDTPEDEHGPCRASLWTPFGRPGQKFARLVVTTIFSVPPRYFRTRSALSEKAVSAVSAFPLRSTPLARKYGTVVVASATRRRRIRSALSPTSLSSHTCASKGRKQPNLSLPR